MTLETTDKLLFIYINSRSLRNAGNLMDKYKKKGQKQLDKEIAQELADQLLNWEDDMMPLEVDDEDDLNWAFLDHLFLTDPDPLQLQSGHKDEDILFPDTDMTFTDAEIAAGNIYWGQDNDIYGV
jgi:hypothetical protein